MNERRSPTAEHIFAQMAGIEARSAVTVRRGGRAVTAELIAWADMIFPMEQRHLDRICERFSGAVLKGETVHVLDPPDEFQIWTGHWSCGSCRRQRQSSDKPQKGRADWFACRNNLTVAHWPVGR